MKEMIKMSSPKRKILLGLTGTVATTLYLKIVKQYQDAGFDVDIIMTEKAKYFLTYELIKLSPFSHHRVMNHQPYEQVVKPDNCLFIDDSAEYDNHHYRKGDEVLHIELKDKYSAFVVICSANTLAKIANGYCDNLLTSVARAWPSYKPFIIAPAMNTDMWNHPITIQHVHAFKNIDRLGYSTKASNHFVVNPQSKMLACGEEGIGALANIDDIVKKTKETLRWQNPFKSEILRFMKRITVPINPHPGAFGYKRKQSTHSGVDLYVASEGMEIRPFEPGIVISVEQFTGTALNTTWWNDTECVLIKGASGVICYGELSPLVKPGQEIKDKQVIGTTKRVIKEDRLHYEITGWSPVMLHVELYPYNVTKAVHGFCDKHLDPTDYILDIAVTMDDEISPVQYEHYKC